MSEHDTTTTAPALPVDAGEGRDPDGWLHTLHMELGQTTNRLTFSAKNPFGERGKDYSPEYAVTSTPLYAAPQPPGVSPAPDALASLKEAADALNNMLGAYDTPISRRRYPPDDFMKACIDSAREALPKARAAIAQAETGKAGTGEPYRVLGTTYDGVDVLAPKTTSERFTQEEIRGAIAKFQGHAAPSPEPRRHGVEAMRERNWAEDAGHENGSYYNTCIKCSERFIGHKRRLVCRSCAALAQHQSPGQTSGGA